MKNILVCTVGSSAAPLVHALRQNAPIDFVVFLCSSGDTDAASDRTVTQVTYRKTKGQCPHCEKKFEVQEAVQPIAGQAELAPGSFEILPIADPDYP